MDHVITITQGFTPDERARGGALYWEAFGRKLRPAFRSPQVGEAIVRAALRPDHFLVARRDGQVLGVRGFYGEGAGAVDLRWSQVRQSLSVMAALRASLVLAPLARTDRSEALVLDGICVDSAGRGRGIGTLLLQAAADHAREIGARAVRLSVVDTNPRARALYERRGFTPVDSGKLGALAGIYGFDGYTTLERPVPA